MATWATLTERSKGRQVRVNLDVVAYMESTGDYTIINVPGAPSLSVHENIDQIAQGAFGDQPRR